MPVPRQNKDPSRTGIPDGADQPVHFMWKIAPCFKPVFSREDLYAADQNIEIRFRALQLLYQPVPLLFTQDRPLTTGPATEAALGADETHRYTVDCESGQFVFGRVDQRGPDCEVTVFGNLILIWNCAYEIQRIK